MVALPGLELPYWRSWQQLWYPPRRSVGFLFPVVGTILKPRQTREFPELGLIVGQPRTLANDNLTTGKNADATLLNLYFVFKLVVLFADSLKIPGDQLGPAGEIVVSQRS